MIYKIIAVRDRAAECFGQPQFVVTIGGSVRSFANEVNRKDENNMMSKHPEDFDLYELGTFNDADASFELLDGPRQIAIGKDLVR